ncbi:ornithine carbamoyltransferase [candidate division KSB1 bacterium]|nr:MAG: ornithine carbamoyltransferase [candidate division KSB1 bacterium]MBC6948485.1 ornithine carbamoyltransferase [candidate division KSB1 bacterium]MCE7942054.1 ornithine carbamoyltransferase [Chlorobi bacterium CHB1]MDL1874391.1 ornithine carbamoyltransferase [Cytophagia bacterium CHB2]
MKKDFLSIADFTPKEIWALWDLAKELKAKQEAGEPHPYLQGKTLGMIFMKPSTRTRISFEVGMFQLGGHALYLSPSEIGLGKREAIADVARVLSRYVDGMMARLFDHEHIVELAKYASVPVINGLTDLLHPCQIVGDMLTILEQRGSFDDLVVAYIGDGNNVANSWINMATKIPFTFRIACPEGYEPNAEIVARARRANVGRIEIVRDPAVAAQGADVLYTDVWASMGQEAEAEERKNVFKNYLIDGRLMAKAKPGAKFMHCLPAHRGEEVTHDVMESPASIIFEQAENRLHIQKAILVTLMGKQS